MLITRRKQGESILIGENVEVMVLEIGQGRVKLGVTAPPHIVVERKEIRLVEDQNRSASAAARSAFVQGILKSRGKGNLAPSLRFGVLPEQHLSLEERENPPGDTRVEHSSLS